jgi:hypothetical protein
MARLAMMGWASASFLPAAATTGAAGLSGGTALAGAAGAGMLGRFLAPTVLGKNVGAMGGMAAMLGAGLAWAAADDQSERTRKVSGGLSGFDIFGKMFDGFVSGGDVNPFKIVDKHQNDLAKQEAMGRGEMNADGSRPFNMTAPQELERFYADQLEATKKQTEGTDQIVKALQSGLVIKEMPPMPIPLPDLGGGPPRVSQ